MTLWFTMETSVNWGMLGWNISLTPQFVLYLHLQRCVEEHIWTPADPRGSMKNAVSQTCDIVELADSWHWALPILWYSLLLSMSQCTKRCFPQWSEVISSVRKSRTLWENMCHVTYLTLGKSEVIVMPKIRAVNVVEVGRACKILTMPWGHWTLLWLHVPTLRSNQD